MKFLCLIYSVEKEWQQLPADQMKERTAAYRSFTEDIRKSPHYIGSNRLHPSPGARTLRERNGALTVTDGPFAETKEQLGGYFLIEATNMEEAIEIASKIPGTRFGCIEVRPVMDPPIP